MVQFSYWRENKSSGEEKQKNQIQAGVFAGA